MSEPLFERVDDNAMPEHLKGKSADEVHAYWVERERQLKAEGGGNPPNPPNPNNPPLPPSPAPPAPPQGMTAGQANTLIQGAKLLASQAKEHWVRFLPQVEGIMGQMSGPQQMDANMWNTVYEKVVGMHMSELVKEAREAALRPPSMESSAPASVTSAPRVLTTAEAHVVEQLRRAGASAIRKDAAGKKQQVPFDAEAYIAADERRQSGAWPLTFNNY